MSIDSFLIKDADAAAAGHSWMRRLGIAATYYNIGTAIQIARNDQ
jgi:hypothetical protein